MKILKDKCVNCGSCALNYPKYFKMQNNKVKILKDTNDKRIFKTCPLNAIIE